MSKHKSPRKPFHQAMSDLIKTVKADAPTLLLGANQQKPAAPLPRPGQTPRFSPFKPRVKTPGLVRTPRRSPPSPLRKGKSVMKSAKSRVAAARRPLFAALVAMILACGGYYLYRSLTMPKVNVTRVASLWFDKSAGKRPHITHHHSTKHSKTVYSGKHKHKVGKAVVKHKKVKSRHKIAAKGKRFKSKHAHLANKKPKRHVQQANYRSDN